MAKAYCGDKDKLRAFFLNNEIAGLQNGAVCNYIVEFELTENAHVKDVCHARAMPRGLNVNAVALHTSILHRTKNNKFYRDWLLDKEKSPWRAVLQDATYIYDDDDEVCAVSINNLGDKPAALTANFLFASRVHSEFAKNSRYLVMEEAHRQGLPVAHAFLIGHAFSLAPQSKDVVIFHPYADDWHSAVNVGGGFFDLGAFIAGTPANTELHDFKWKDGGLVRINLVWHALGDKRRVLDVIRDSMQRGGKERYRGVFAGAFAIAEPKIQFPGITSGGEEGAPVKIADIVAARNKWEGELNVKAG